MTSIASFSHYSVEPPQEWCEVRWDRTVINTIYSLAGLRYNGLIIHTKSVSKLDQIQIPRNSLNPEIDRVCASSNELSHWPWHKEEGAVCININKYISWSSSQN